MGREAGDVFLNFVFGFICGILEDCSGLRDRADMTRLATKLRWGVNRGVQYMFWRLGWYLKATLGQMGRIFFIYYGWIAVECRQGVNFL